MRNLSFLLLTLVFVSAAQAQKNENKPLQISAGVLYVPAEFKFSTKKLSESEKESLSSVPQSDGKPIIAYYLGAARPLNKKTIILAKIHFGFGSNDSTEGHSHFWNNPNNSTENYIVVNPAMGIEGVFDYISYSGPLNASTKYSFQELSLGIARKFGDRIQLEATYGLDHRRQNTTIKTENRKYIVNYTTETTFSNNTYFIDAIPLAVNHEKLGESEEVIIQDLFNGSLRASAVVDVIRTKDKKLILAVEGGAKLLIGGDGTQVNSNVGLKVTKKL